MTARVTPSSVDRSTPWRLFDQRLRWGPTWRGWVFLCAGALAATVGFVHTVHSFLAVDRPVVAEMLVVEGWIPEYALRQCTKMINTGSYQRVITVGGPVTGASLPAPDDETHAYVARSRLRKMGVPADVVQMVPTRSGIRDRTFHCATDLRRWLEEHRLSPQAMNVVTMGPHARRSRLLFETAFGNGVQVGIIAIENQDYEPSRWWRSSEGVKEVIAESAAYLYARLLFHPETPAVHPG